LHTVENRKCTGQAIEKSADMETGLLERQIQARGNTDEQFRGPIIECIRTSLEASIAQEQGNCIVGMAGYSNDDDALRWKFGIDLEPEVSESTAGGHADLGGQHGQRELPTNQCVVLGGVAEADTLLQARGTDLEDKEDNYFTTSL